MCRDRTIVTQSLVEKKRRVSSARGIASVSKTRENMRSNTNRARSKSSKSSSSRPKSNDGDSYSNSNTNSVSRSNSQSNSNSQTNSHAQSLPSVVCIEGNKSVFAAMVGRVVKHNIFPKKQFIILERELDENGKLAETCVQALNLERSKWHSVRNIVRLRLNRVRNNAQQNVRNKLLSKSVVVFLLSN